jgi:uncharacterized protein
VTRDEAARLRDILQAARTIQEYTATDPRLDDALVQDAVQFRLSVIGEAVKTLAPATQAKEPEIPWSLWAKQRDLISHSYFRVDPSLMAETVAKDIPALIDAVERLLRD